MNNKPHIVLKLKSQYDLIKNRNIKDFSAWRSSCLIYISDIFGVTSEVYKQFDQPYSIFDFDMEPLYVQYELLLSDIIELTDSKNNMNKASSDSLIKVFISHSSDDENIVEELIHLFQKSISRLEDNDIRCSSVRGYQYKSGEDFYEKIKNESGLCQIIICCLSESSLLSPVVLFECGIGWYLDKLIPVIIDDNIDYNDLPGPIKNKITKKANDKSDLLDVIEDISKKLSLSMNKNSKVNRQIDKFIDNNF